MGRTLKLGKGNPRQPDKGGALVEITCETDFVARTAELEELATRLAEQMRQPLRGDRGVVAPRFSRFHLAEAP